MKESSREKALDTARALFMEKGKDGVKMQEIADRAGINKGLLHYYFKSKNDLFLEIFLSEVHLIYADINRILKSEISMDEKLSAIIDQYFNLLSEKPNLPTFVMFEINKHPELAPKLANDANLQETVQLLDSEFRANRITSTPEFAFQVILNIISLCVFPFAMRPLVQELGKRNGADWNQLMDGRKSFLKRLIINSFKP
jgi:AcrR family transcriptional regulator